MSDATAAPSPDPMSIDNAPPDPPAELAPSLPELSVTARGGALGVLLAGVPISDHVGRIAIVAVPGQRPKVEIELNEAAADVIDMMIDGFRPTFVEGSAARAAGDFLAALPEADIEQALLAVDELASMADGQGTRVKAALAALLAHYSAGYVAADPDEAEG